MSHNAHPHTESPLTESWIAIPPNGRRCPVTGLGHSRFYRLLSAAGGAIRSVSLKEEGQNRATRLVDRVSLLAYRLLA